MAKESIKIYHRLMKYVWPFWPAFVIAAIGNVICSSMDAYAVYFLKPLLDKGFVGRDAHFLSILPLIIIGIFLLRGIGNILSTYFTGYVSKKMVLILREQMFTHIMHLPAKFFDHSASARLLTKLTYNVDQIIQATGNTFTTLVQQSCFLAGLIAVMFITNWHLTLLIFLVLPFLVALVKYVSNRFRKLSRRIQSAVGDVMHIAEQSIIGYREVKIFGVEQQQIQQFDKSVEYNFIQEMKITLTDALNSPIIQIFCSIILAVVIYFAVDRSGGNIMSAGSFAALISAMLASFKPIRDLSQVNNNIQRGLAAAEGIFQLLDEPAEADTGQKIIQKAHGNIHLENVSFRYHADSAITLDNISLEIPAGKTVAFVGRSGAGKSSLVSLLLRFYTPTQGKILLDDIDMQEIKLCNLRSQFAMVSQHVTLFDDTILYNVAYGSSQNASEEDAIKALKTAHAWEFVQRLPQGIKTIVGENGFNLSGGQRQRIAIARAILKQAPILILDEATSALDNESERAIQSALQELRRNHTVLVIAHRLSTIENADLIVVMDQGKIIEQDTHAELLKQRGLYAQLHASASFS